MQKTNEITKKLEKLNIVYRTDEPMNKHTSFKIGGKAKFFCEVLTNTQMREIIRTCKKMDVDYFLLGKGSNVIFSDAGYDGLILKFTNNTITITDNIVHAEAGVSLASLCNALAEHGLSGLEFAYGIPGSVGGAVFMNAGAYGGEIKDVICEVEYIDNAGDVKTYTKEQLQLAYRQSVFEKTGECIVSAKFILNHSDTQTIKTTMQETLQKRVDKQPLDMPSAGSAFKRPEGAFAAALIEDCGLKGFTVGGVQVSQKHSGFLVNIGGATCKDIIDITGEIAKIVLEKTGYELEREVKIIEN